MFVMLFKKMPGLFQSITFTFSVIYKLFDSTKTKHFHFLNYILIPPKLKTIAFLIFKKKTFTFPIISIFWSDLIALAVFVFTALWVLAVSQAVWKRNIFKSCHLMKSSKRKCWLSKAFSRGKFGYKEIHISRLSSWRQEIVYWFQRKD